MWFELVRLARYWASNHAPASARYTCSLINTMHDDQTLEIGWMQPSQVSHGTRDVITHHVQGTEQRLPWSDRSLSGPPVREHTARPLHARRTRRQADKAAKHVPGNPMHHTGATTWMRLHHTIVLSSRNIFSQTNTLSNTPS